MLRVRVERAHLNCNPHFAEIFMMTPLSRVTVATLLVTSTLFAGALQAAEVNDNLLVIQTREVRYSDLDLKSEKGVARLHARIKGAAKAVCGDEGYSTIATYIARDKCREKAIADATNYVNVALLKIKSESKVAP